MHPRQRSGRTSRRNLQHDNHGRAGLSRLLWGWTYCGWGYTDYTGDGDNLLTTDQGISPGLPDGNHNFHFWSYHPNGTVPDRRGSVHYLSYSIGFSHLPGPLDLRRGRSDPQCLVAQKELSPAAGKAAAQEKTESTLSAGVKADGPYRRDFRLEP